MFKRPSLLSLVCVSALLAVSFPVFAITIEELRCDPKMSPDRFASHFKNFKYEFRAAVQTPEEFLATECGDCDDYATLAATILKEKGFTPRLVAVRMKKLVHVVCYVEETKTILDFNHRKNPSRARTSGYSLAEIATSIGRDFKEPWTSASEFTFEKGAKRLVATVVPRSRDVNLSSVAKHTRQK